MSKKAKTIFAKINKRKFFWLSFVMLWFVILTGFFVTLGHLKKYKEKVYPRVFFYQENLGGQNKAEALALIRKATADLEKQNLALMGKQKTISASLSELGINLETETMAQNALAVGRQGNIGQKIKEVIQARFLGVTIEPSFSLDQEKFNLFIAKSFIQEGPPARPAQIVYSSDNFTIIPEQNGSGVDELALLTNIVRSLKEKKQQLTFPVDILQNKTPATTQEEALPAANKANSILSRTYRLSAGQKNWEMSREFLVAMLDFKTPIQKEKEKQKKEILTPSAFAASKTYQTLKEQAQKRTPKTIEVFLKEEAALDYLTTIAPGVEQPAENAVLAFTDNQLKITTPSQNEIKLDVQAGLAHLTDKILAEEESIALPLLNNPAPVSETTLESLGLKTLLAQGESNFVGSPKNRKHNITVGAARFNGVLIAPEEEFSFLTRLGPVDKSTGYLPELVIKENKTIPEYGGGMCQVSTTAFRGAVNTGLKITQRKNHAYPVQYYAPQGTDATVYIPSPDLKFKNNTPGHIYIQTRIEGTKLFFEYYGTSDGRSVKTEGPITYDRTGDGGMRAKWIQKVYNSDGTLSFEDTFLSKYDSPNKYPHPGDEPPPAEEKKKKKKR